MTDDIERTEQDEEQDRLRMEAALAEPEDEDGVDLHDLFDHDEWVDIFGEDEVEHVALDPKVIRWMREQRIMDIAGLRKLPPVPWFIGGLVPAAGLTVVHGHGSSRKSFIVLDWMLCAATNRQWFDHDVRPGSVLWIAGEGVYGTGKRIEAWAKREGIADPDSITEFHIMPQALNFFRLGHEKERFAEVVEQARAWVAFNDYDYIVVDTLRQASGGGEENSSTDIGIVYDTARRIAGRAALIFIHHDPKNASSKSARGSSAIMDDSDITIHVEGDPADSFSKISPGKVRDAKPFTPFPIHFTEHVLGQDRDGNPITSIAASSLGTTGGKTPQAITAGAVNLPDAEAAVLTFMANGGTYLGVWPSANKLVEDAGLNRKNTLAAIKSLRASGRIVLASDGKSLTLPD